MDIIIFLSVSLPVILFITFLYKTITLRSYQQEVCADEGVDIDNSAILNLSKAIQFKTISMVNGSEPDFSEFTRFHKHLDSTYPLINKYLQKEIIEKYSLLYKWEGTKAELKPLILLAHMDVVPIDRNTKRDWLFEPFEGKVDHENIWGRGTLDNKMSLVAIMEAIEHLLSENFVPERTIYLAFGHDEECYGTKGARAIAHWMRGKGITAELILDEGLAISSGLIPGMKEEVAMVGIAEKGTAYIELSVVQEPGHLSMPPHETAIHVLSRAVSKLQEFNMPVNISTPVQEFFKFLAPELPFISKTAFANKFFFQRQIIKAYERSDAGNATIRSTITPTIFQSGVAENSSPTRARVVLQVKVLPGEKLEHIISQMEKVINEPKVEVYRVDKMYDEAMGISPIDSKAFTTLSKTIKQVFPHIITVPALCIATTDSRHFHDISRNIYRFSPFRLSPENLGSIHGVNERVLIEDYHDAINFYIRLVKNMKHSAFQLSFTT